MVVPFPGFKIVLVQVLVGQSQRAKAFAGVLLLEVERVRTMSRTVSDERTKASLTLRCEVVTSFSLLQDGWSLSKMMVSAPLQYRVSFPSGLRTGATEEVWIIGSRRLNAEHL